MQTPTTDDLELPPTYVSLKSGNNKNRSVSYADKEENGSFFTNYASANQKELNLKIDDELQF